MDSAHGTAAMVLLGAAVFMFTAPASHGGDWPVIHGNLARDGYTDDCVEPPYVKRWIRSFPLEIMTTRTEAIVAEGKVFAGTYSGRMHALDAESGGDLWTCQADGPILHSPAYDASRIYFATASPGATVYCLVAGNGSVIWKTRCGDGGFDTSPTVVRGQVLLGGRDGVFYALDSATGRIAWRFPTQGPIRNTAAVDHPRVYFASDDMHAYALELPQGKLLWRSEKMYGQSLRDYYPVVAGNAVVFRTNPMEQMGVHLGRSYHLIGSSAGIDMSSWKNVDAWCKSDKARGNPRAHEREQRTVLEYLEKHPQARTFYVLEGATGAEAVRAPVLWGAGCQGVGVPPVRWRRDPDAGKQGNAAGSPGQAPPSPEAGPGAFVVFTRTAYSNWTRGVAPMVGLGFMDLEGNLRPPEGPLGPLPTARLTPIFHSRGVEPPWNTFWGTADETTVYSCGGHLIYATHQGTLAAYDTRDGNLFTVWGKRDTWGGEKGLAWARNEWHGPGRGAVAISGASLYWITGSRIIALRGRPARVAGAGPPTGAEAPAGAPGGTRAPGGHPPTKRRGEASPEASDRKAPVDGESPSDSQRTLPGDGAEGGEGRRIGPTLARPAAGPLPEEDTLLRYVRERPVIAGMDTKRTAELRKHLEGEVRTILEKPNLAPLLVEIGLGSHDFFFDTAAETITAFALAYPHLDAGLQAAVKDRARKEMEAHPLCGRESRYPLDGGERRELYTITRERFFYGWEAPQPLPEAYAMMLWGERTGDWEPVEKLWPRAKRAFTEFVDRGWQLDGDKGDRFANAYVAGLIGIARLAPRFGDPDAGRQAEKLAAANLRRLIQHWQAGVGSIPISQEIAGVAEVDRFIKAGNALSFTIVPHRHKMAKFLDLVPEIGRSLHDFALEPARHYMSYVDIVMPGWYLAFEERQIHWGENYIDFPDLALSVFRVKAFITQDEGPTLQRYLDIPWCAGDLYHIEKLVLAIEATGRMQWTEARDP